MRFVENDVVEALFPQEALVLLATLPLEDRVGTQDDIDGPVVIYKNINNKNNKAIGSLTGQIFNAPQLPILNSIGQLIPQAIPFFLRSVIHNKLHLRTKLLYFVHPV